MMTAHQFRLQYPKMRQCDVDDYVRQVISRFPAQFGLRAFPGKTFKISFSASFVTEGIVMLYTFIKTDGDRWGAFCKGTVEEIEPEMIWWQSCPEHGKQETPSGSCHECAMLMPRPVDIEGPQPGLDFPAHTCVDQPHLSCPACTRAGVERKEA